MPTTLRRIHESPEPNALIPGACLFALLGLGLLGCSGEQVGVPSGSASGTVFEGARLISGEGGLPIEDAVFVVEDGRFTEVGARGEVDVPSTAQRVDLTGQTVMPALVNSHMHLATTREELVEQLRHNAYYGAAAVVSLGQDAGEETFALRDEVISGAARFLTAGRGITRPEPGRSEVPYWIGSEEEGREAVRELAAQGVDIVKIWVDDRGGQYEKLTPELYGPIIEEAHAMGLQVTAHIFTLEDAKGLLAAGIDAFAHGVRDREIDGAFLQLVAEHPETVYVPNLADPGIARDLSWLSGTVSPDQLRSLQEAATDRPEAQEAFAIQARNLERVNDAGMTIAFGTDGSAPWAVHLEMEDMVRAGMSPEEVIVAATRNSAELLELDELGTIEPGKSADFLVLDGNPLEDITNTRRISSVYLRGAMMDRGALSERLIGGARPVDDPYFIEHEAIPMRPKRVDRKSVLSLALGVALGTALSPAPVPLAAQSGVALDEGRSMRIGIIGAGAMGGPLGQLWASVGHQVLYASRNPQELMDLVQSAAPMASAGYADAAAYFGDVILLAVPPSAIPQIGSDYGHLMEGKIVIDITNPRVDRDGEITDEWLAMGTGLAMAQYIPGARMVKAFNTLGAGMLADPRSQDPPIGVPIAGDDAEARETVATLVRDAGFEPVIVGPLERASEFDRGTDVWVTGMTAAEVRESLGLPPDA